MVNQKGLSPIGWIAGVSTLILFASSVFRHELFQSSAFDLGIFDQAVYLISQGKEPVTTIQGFHILGDHAAFVHYLLALPYKIYPSVYWLFLIQAIALSFGALPTYGLAIQAGLKENQAISVAIAYLLYPLVSNVNLYDFHPEVIALPALLAAILAARLGKTTWFCLSIILILSCKAVLSLTVAAMGIWLLFFEKKRLYGAIALSVGIAWFLIATKFIIPFYSGAEAAAVSRYGYLGTSVFDIARNLIFHPERIFTKIFSLDNLGYLILLFAPVAWGLSLKKLDPLIGAFPCVALNILADYHPQKDLVFQYSLPAVPFLMLAVISSLESGRGWLQHQRQIIIWSLISFLSLTKFTYFFGKYFEFMDNWPATREAIALVPDQDSVYTNSQIAPHLSHRQIIKFTDINAKKVDLNTFKYVLLNIRHPGWVSTSEFVKSLVTELEANPSFQLKYQHDDVDLFVREAK